MKLSVVFSRLKDEKHTASKSEEAMEVEIGRMSMKRSRDNSTSPNTSPMSAHSGQSRNLSNLTTMVSQHPFIPLKARRSSRMDSPAPSTSSKADLSSFDPIETIEIEDEMDDEASLQSDAQ